MLLLAAYVTVWGDAGRQGYIRFVSYPILTSVYIPVETTTPLQAGQMATQGDDRRLQVRSEQPGAFRHTAPAGVRFLLPALALCLLAPRRPYWLVLFGGHLVLAAVDAGVLALGGGVHAGFFQVHHLLERYLIDVFSLGMAVLGGLHAMGGLPPPASSGS